MTRSHNKNTGVAPANLLQALDCMSDAFYMLDRDWNFIYLNRVAEVFIGVDRQALLGRSIWREFPETVATGLYQRYLEAMKSGRSQHFEFLYQPGNRWVEINAHPNDDGLGVYFRAIDERKRLEQRIHEAEERFRLVAQATVDTIWDWDLKTGALWWNEGIQTMFGYDPEELEPDGRSWTRRLHPDDRKAAIAHIESVVIDPALTRWDHEYRFRRKDGRYALVQDRGFVIRRDDGEALRMVGGMTDITEARSLESRLRDAQRMEAVGQLTGGMAHDFNNLLTVILGNADLLAETLESDRLLGPLATIISDAAQRGADLTQRLLAFARRQALDPAPTGVNELVDELTTMLMRTLGDPVELQFFPDPDLWPAMVDPVQLESALLNLCLNARDAMADGGQLTIETGNTHLEDSYTRQFQDLEPGDYVQITVSDTGTGIPPALTRKVFEPFFSTKETSRGSGLGLSMVYGFLKQSGGHVNLYSESGAGTSVKLYLPRHRGDAVARREPAATNQGEPTGHETILVVEDERLVREFVTRQLESAGYRVLTASNGPEALVILQSPAGLDLLFTDVMMPGGMSGRELADQCQSLRPGLPVLFTSGYTENAIVHNGRLDPGVQLLGKPYRKTELLRKIREVLASERY